MALGARKRAPVVEILHEVDLRFEGVHLFLIAVPEIELLHSKQLPGSLVQSFENLQQQRGAGDADKVSQERANASNDVSATRKCAYVGGRRSR